MLSNSEIQVVICSILVWKIVLVGAIVFVIVLQLSDCGFFIFRNGCLRMYKEKHKTPNSSFNQLFYDLWN